MSETKFSSEEAKGQRQWWSHNETAALISIFGDERVTSRLQGTRKDSIVYCEMSAQLKEMGFARSGEQMKNKIKKLIEAYRKTKTVLARSGSGRTSTCEFFDELDDILADRASTKPKALLDSRKRLNEYQEEAEDSDEETSSQKSSLSDAESSDVEDVSGLISKLGMLPHPADRLSTSLSHQSSCSSFDLNSTWSCDSPCEADRGPSPPPTRPPKRRRSLNLRDVSPDNGGFNFDPLTPGPPRTADVESDDRTPNSKTADTSIRNPPEVTPKSKEAALPNKLPVKEQKRKRSSAKDFKEGVEKLNREFFHHQKEVEKRFIAAEKEREERWYEEKRKQEEMHKQDRQDRDNRRMQHELNMMQILLTGVRPQTSTNTSMHQSQFRRQTNDMLQCNMNQNHFSHSQPESYNNNEPYPETFMEQLTTKW
ncbi:PREDICTED: PH domain-containing protein DDB_G0287875-like [Priapulus caudatus]|uniref:PH domain-containing protein DDB_G0287875-like n=1 Tax=Priapulus caudatus TaxID=37621 RepID=A0ABM1F8A4_PRICU|nr:PREDICTED: PH domain-containing protein DDB_G0287875-like [Priapulus caudatus]